MNVVRKEEIYTIDDIYTLPEGQREEYAFGDIVPVGIFEDFSIKIPNM